MHADRGDVPFGPFHVVDGHERRFASHREPHIVFPELLIDEMSQTIDVVPLLIGIRQRDPRVFVNPRDFHLEMKLGLALFQRPRNRGRGGWGGRRGERQMAFAREEPGRRIKPDPAGAGQIDFAPGVQVGEILLRTGGTVQRFHVRLQLDQISRNEPGRQPRPPQQLHQQPGGVAARTGPRFQSIIGRLHAGLHPDEVTDVPPQPLVEVD